LVLSSAYVLARRLFELVVLLWRGERSKELEILLLRHELSILRVAGQETAVRAARSAAAWLRSAGCSRVARGRRSSFE
jgi:hypothetical protein